MFMQKLRKDKRGLSLIELVCAMAILSIITLTISGAMVFASNSYRQGSVDTALQQELQFTVNAIESLIVDATQDVSFTGNVFKVVNMDYTYEIVYDAVAKTLRYSQYGTADGALVADNELLADNVTHFFVDTTNFATARNVVMDIKFANGNSELDYKYNLTSRNDVSAGEVPEVVVQFKCDSTIVIEPLQTYFLEIDVIGPSGTDYSATPVGNVSGATEVIKAPGGVNITLSATETGDANGRFTLHLASSVMDSEGHPFTKDVEILVRRVNDVTLSTPTFTGGGAYDANTTYSCTATAIGTNMERRADLNSDKSPYDYINPDSFVWSFEVSDGLVEDWITVGPNGKNNNEIEITLKKDVELGHWVRATATPVHTTGEQKNGAWSNKASAVAGMQMQYDDIPKSFEIKPISQVGDSDFRRGDDFDIPLARDIDALIKEDWESNPENDGKEFDPNKDGYNAGYTGNHHIRYISLDDGELTSVGYPAWKKMSYQGMDMSKIEFKAGDLSDMRYMQTYKLELVYSFTYMNKNNEKCTYPHDFDPSKAEQNPKDIYTWIIDPIEVHFGTAQSGSDPSINLEQAGLLTESGHGIGSQDEPLIVNKNGSLGISYTTIGPGANDKAGVKALLEGHQELWKYDIALAKWVKAGTVQLQNSFNGSDPKKQTGKIYIDTNNLSKDVPYKLVLGNIKPAEEEPKTAEDTGGWVHTNETGYEQYALDNGNGSAARGLIYFMLH